MKAFKVVYRHGKLYDIETQKRVLINENSVLNLIIEDQDILETDPYNKVLLGKESKDLLKEIEEKQYHSHKLIAHKNDLLEFIIKAGKNAKTKKYTIDCTFTVKLLSDLYLFQKTKEMNYGIVYPCDCVVESVNGPIENFEPLYAYSLNDAYMKTYEFFFHLYGKPTANIYNKFWLLKNGKKESLWHLRMF